MRELLAAYLSVALLATAPLSAGSLSAFFGPERGAVVALAADGTAAAYEEPPVDGRPAQVAIVPLDGKYLKAELPLPPAAESEPTDRIAALQWSESDRLVVETVNGHVFSLDRSAGNERDLSGPKSRRSERERPNSEEKKDPKPYQQTTTGWRYHVTSFPKAGSRLALVAVSEKHGADWEPVDELRSWDVSSGETRVEIRAPLLAPYGTYGYDHEGHVRWVGATSSDWRKIRISTAPKGWSDWTGLGELVPVGFGSGMDVVFLGAGQDPMTLLLAVRKPGEPYRIEALDVSTRRLTERAPLPEAIRSFDQSGSAPAVVYDWPRRLLVGVRAITAQPLTVWLDPAFATAQAKIQEQFPGRRVEIIAWDVKADSFAARVNGSDDPGRIYVASAAAWDMPLELVHAVPHVSAEDVGSVDRLSVKAGELTVLGRLTCPSNPALPREPVILLMPGESRDVGFDVHAQAFASLGYVVFAPQKALAASDWPGVLAALAQKYPLDPSHAVLVGEGAERLLGTVPGLAYAVTPTTDRKGKSALSLAAVGAPAEVHPLAAPLKDLDPADAASAYRAIDAFLSAHGAPHAPPRKGWFWQ